MFINIQEQFKHLNNNQLDQIIQDYYVKRLLVKDIVNQYRINITVASFIKSFPNSQDDTNRCPNCNKPIVKTYLTRSQSTNQNERYIKYVLDCKHCSHNLHNLCNCSYCEEQKKELIRINRLKKQKHEQKLVYEFIDSVTKTPVDFDKCSAKDKIYLMTLIQMNGIDAEGLINTTPIQELFDEKITKLVPHPVLYSDILITLEEKGIIKLSNKSQLSAFNFTTIVSSVLTGYSPFRVMYELNINYNGDLIKLIENLHTPTYIAINKEEIKEIYGILSKYIFAKALSYMSNRHNLYYDNFEQINLEKLNTHFRNHSIYYLLNHLESSSFTASARLNSKKLGEYGAMNYVINSVNYKANRNIEYRDFGLFDVDEITYIEELLFKKYLGYDKDYYKQLL